MIMVPLFSVFNMESEMVFSIFLGIACILFFMAAINWPQSPINLLALGLLALALGFLLERIS